MAGTCGQPTPNGPCQRDRRRDGNGCGMTHHATTAHAMAGNGTATAAGVAATDPFVASSTIGLVPVIPGAGFDANHAALTRHILNAIRRAPTDWPDPEDLRGAIEQVRTDLLNTHPGADVALAHPRPRPVPLTGEAIRDDLDGMVPSPAGHSMRYGTIHDRLAGLDALHRDYAALRDKMLNGSPPVQPLAAADQVAAATKILSAITRVGSGPSDGAPLTTEELNEAFPPGTRVRTWTGGYRRWANDFTVAGPAELDPGREYRGPHDRGVDASIRMPVLTDTGEQTSVGFALRGFAGGRVMETYFDEDSIAQAQATVALGAADEFHQRMLAKSRSYDPRGHVDDEVAYCGATYEMEYFIAHKTGMRPVGDALQRFVDALNSHPRFDLTRS